MAGGTPTRAQPKAAARTHSPERLRAGEIPYSEESPTAFDAWKLRARAPLPPADAGVWAASGRGAAPERAWDPEPWEAPWDRDDSHVGDISHDVVERDSGDADLEPPSPAAADPAPIAWVETDGIVGISSLRSLDAAHGFRTARTGKERGLKGIWGRAFGRKREAGADAEDADAGREEQGEDEAADADRDGRGPRRAPVAVASPPGARLSRVIEDADGEAEGEEAAETGGGAGPALMGAAAGEEGAGADEAAPARLSDALAQAGALIAERSGWERKGKEGLGGKNKGEEEEKKKKKKKKKEKKKEKEKEKEKKKDEGEHEAKDRRIAGERSRTNGAVGWPVNADAVTTSGRGLEPCAEPSGSGPKPPGKRKGRATRFPAPMALPLRRPARSLFDRATPAWRVAGRRRSSEASSTSSSSESERASPSTVSAAAAVVMTTLSSATSTINRSTTSKWPALFKGLHARGGGIATDANAGETGGTSAERKGAVETAAAERPATDATPFVSPVATTASSPAFSPAAAIATRSGHPSRVSKIETCTAAEAARNGAWTPAREDDRRSSSTIVLAAMAGTPAAPGAPHAISPLPRRPLVRAACASCSPPLAAPLDLRTLHLYSHDPSVLRVPIRDLSAALAALDAPSPGPAPDLARLVQVSPPSSPPEGGAARRKARSDARRFPRPTAADAPVLTLETTSGNFDTFPHGPGNARLLSQLQRAGMVLDEGKGGKLEAEGRGPSVTDAGGPAAERSNDWRLAAVDSARPTFLPLPEARPSPSLAHDARAPQPPSVAPPSVAFGGGRCVDAEPSTSSEERISANASARSSRIASWFGKLHRGREDTTASTGGAEIQAVSPLAEEHQRNVEGDKGGVGAARRSASADGRARASHLSREASDEHPPAGRDRFEETLTRQGVRFPQAKGGEAVAGAPGEIEVGRRDSQIASQRCAIESRPPRASWRKGEVAVKDAIGAELEGRATTTGSSVGRGAGGDGSALAEGISHALATGDASAPHDGSESLHSTAFASAPHDGPESLHSTALASSSGGLLSVPLARSSPGAPPRRTSTRLPLWRLAACCIAPRVRRASGASDASDDESVSPPSPSSTSSCLGAGRREGRPSSHRLGLLENSFQISAQRWERERDSRGSREGGGQAPAGSEEAREGGDQGPAGSGEVDLGRSSAWAERSPSENAEATGSQKGAEAVGASDVHGAVASSARDALPLSRPLHDHFAPAHLAPPHGAFDRSALLAEMRSIHDELQGGRGAAGGGVGSVHGHWSGHGHKESAAEKAVSKRAPEGGVDGGFVGGKNAQDDTPTAAFGVLAVDAFRLDLTPPPVAPPMVVATAAVVSPPAPLTALPPALVLPPHLALALNLPSHSQSAASSSPGAVSVAGKRTESEEPRREGGSWGRGDTTRARRRRSSDRSSTKRSSCRSSMDPIEAWQALADEILRDEYRSTESGADDAKGSANGGAREGTWETFGDDKAGGEAVVSGGGAGVDEIDAAAARFSVFSLPARALPPPSAPAALVSSSAFDLLRAPRDASALPPPPSPPPPPPIATFGESAPPGHSLVERVLRAEREVMREQAAARRASGGKASEGGGEVSRGAGDRVRQSTFAVDPKVRREGSAREHGPVDESGARHGPSSSRLASARSDSERSKRGGEGRDGDAGRKRARRNGRVGKGAGEATREGAPVATTGAPTTRPTSPVAMTGAPTTRPTSPVARPAAPAARTLTFRAPAGELGALPSSSLPAVAVETLPPTVPAVGAPSSPCVAPASPSASPLRSLDGSRRVGDLYEELEELGRGAFGVATRARRRADGVVVCVKRFSVPAGRDLLEARRRALDEAEATEAARCAFSVALLDVFEGAESDREGAAGASGGAETVKGAERPGAALAAPSLELQSCPALVLEYCPNGTLERAVRDPRRAAALIRGGVEGPGTEPSSNRGASAAGGARDARVTPGSARPPLLPPPSPAPPRSLDEEAAMLAWTQLALALAHAHAAGFAHRDVKPANALLDASGRVRLCDYGLAQRLRRRGVGGAAARAGERGSGGANDAVRGRCARGSLPSSCRDAPPRPPSCAPSPLDPASGTPQYLPPERLLGRAGGARGDVWAAGCVLYELAKGSKAFGGSSVPAVALRALRARPAPLDERAFSPHFRALVAWLLEREQGDRPEMREVLETRYVQSYVRRVLRGAEERRDEAGGEGAKAGSGGRESGGGADGRGGRQGRTAGVGARGAMRARSSSIRSSSASSAALSERRSPSPPRPSRPAHPAAVPCISTFARLSGPPSGRRHAAPRPASGTPPTHRVAGRAASSASPAAAAAPASTASEAARRVAVARERAAAASRRRAAAAGAAAIGGVVVEVAEGHPIHGRVGDAARRSRSASAVATGSLASASRRLTSPPPLRLRASLLHDPLDARVARAGAATARRGGDRPGRALLGLCREELAAEAATQGVA